MLTHDGSTRFARDEKGHRFKYGKICIWDNVFIGVNAIILPNTIIGNNVIIGAGSIVTKSIEYNSIYAGNPAKKIGNFSDLMSNYLETCICEDDWDKNKSYKENITEFIKKNDKKNIYFGVE